MDLLIKNMEMPKSCDICPFCKSNDNLGIEDYRHLYCDFPTMGEFVTDYEASRHPSCPLVEVPPHDDLISRKDAISAVYGYHFNNHPMKELEELTPVIQASQGMENKPYYSDSPRENNMWDGE